MNVNFWLPTPEKLTALGFVGNSSNFERHYNGEKQYIATSCDSPARRVAFWRNSEDGFRVVLRSEAEFDLLLWQIGWTDAEPQIHVLTEESVEDYGNEMLAWGDCPSGPSDFPKAPWQQ